MCSTGVLVKANTLSGQAMDISDAADECHSYRYDPIVGEIILSHIVGNRGIKRRIEETWWLLGSLKLRCRNDSCNHQHKRNA